MCMLFCARVVVDAQCREQTLNGRGWVVVLRISHTDTEAITFSVSCACRCGIVRLNHRRSGDSGSSQAHTRTQTHTQIQTRTHVRIAHDRTTWSVSVFIQISLTEALVVSVVRMLCLSECVYIVCIKLVFQVERNLVVGDRTSST